MLILYYTLKSACFQSAHVGKSETSGSLGFENKSFLISSREPGVVCLDSITLLDVVYANILYYTLKSECFQSAHVGKLDFPFFALVSL